MVRGGASIPSGSTNSRVSSAAPRDRRQQTCSCFTSTRCFNYRGEWFMHRACTCAWLEETAIRRGPQPNTILTNTMNIEWNATFRAYEPKDQAKHKGNGQNSEANDCHYEDVDYHNANGQGRVTLLVSVSVRVRAHIPPQKKGAPETRAHNNHSDRWTHQYATVAHIDLHAVVSKKLID